MRILIASSGRASSEPALKQGAYLAKALNVKPTVMLVQEREQGEGQADLKAALDTLASLGVEAEPKLRQGSPAEVIIDEVQAEGYDLVILGQGHKPTFLERVFGDTTKRVLGAIPCPVLIAKGTSQEFTRILVCDSLASEGALVMGFLEHFVDLLSEGSEVTVLHVMSQMSAGPNVESWELEATADELMNAQTLEGELITEDISKFQGKSKVKALAKVRHGMVVEEIITEAREGNYDLLVLGAHRGEGWQRLLLENLAKEIVANSRLPVLVMPREDSAD